MWDFRRGKTTDMHSQMLRACPYITARAFIFKPTPMHLHRSMLWKPPCNAFYSGFYWQNPPIIAHFVAYFKQIFKIQNLLYLHTNIEKAHNSKQFLFFFGVKKLRFLEKILHRGICLQNNKNQFVSKPTKKLTWRLHYSLFHLKI